MVLAGDSTAGAQRQLSTQAPLGSPPAQVLPQSAALWSVPVRPHASTVHRFIQPRVHDAERCSQTAALQRLLYSDSSLCRRFWCLPRPPAPSWFGDYALCCKAPRGPPSRPARRDAARRDWRATALTKRNNFVLGSDASEASPCQEAPLGPHKVDE
ncbi:hypothetical protein NN561_020009 [Cricetulus griseus]